MEEMNLFGSVEHNDDNTDKWTDLPENPTNQDMLNYMLVIARYLGCHKAFQGGYMLNQLLGEQSRLTHDTVQCENLPFIEEVLVQYEHAWNKLILTNVAGKSLIKPAFSETLKRYYHVAMSLKYGEVHESGDRISLSWR